MPTRPQAPGPAAHSTRDSRQTIAAEDESGLRRGFGSNRLPTTPREPTWLHCRMGTFALFVGLAALFVYLSHRPLWHTDLWGHLAYGRLIATQRTIPAAEPLLPLCQSVPFVDFSWLSEVIGYAAESWRGVEALQFLYASAVITGVGLLALCTLRKTGSAAAAALAAALYVWVDWQQLAIMRPQLAGSACFLGVFLLSAGGAWRGTATRFRLAALATALLFAAWANLHGSFLIGLVLLAAFILGRAIDLLRRTGRLRAVREDRRLRRGLIVLMLAAGAVPAESLRLANLPDRVGAVSERQSAGPGRMAAAGLVDVAGTVGFGARAGSARPLHVDATTNFRDRDSVARRAGRGDARCLADDRLVGAAGRVLCVAARFGRREALAPRALGFTVGNSVHGRACPSAPRGPGRMVDPLGFRRRAGRRCRVRAAVDAARRWIVCPDRPHGLPPALFRRHAGRGNRLFVRSSAPRADLQPDGMG